MGSLDWIFTQKFQPHTRKTKYKELQIGIPTRKLGEHWVVQRNCSEQCSALSQHYVNMATQKINRKFIVVFPLAQTTYAH